MIERTENYDRVKRFLDAHPIRANHLFSWEMSSEVIHLIDVIDGVDTSLWIFEPVGRVNRLHTIAAPEDTEGGVRAMSWLYENTDANVIIAPIPELLRRTQGVVITMGMRERRPRQGFMIYSMNRKRFDQMKEAA